MTSFLLALASSKLLKLLLLAKMPMPLGGGGKASEALSPRLGSDDSRASRFIPWTLPKEAVAVAERINAIAVGGPRDTLRRACSSLERARSKVRLDLAGFACTGRFVAVPGLDARLTGFGVRANFDTSPETIFGPPNLRLIDLQVSGSRAEKLGCVLLVSLCGSGLGGEEFRIHTTAR